MRLSFQFLFQCTKSKQIKVKNFKYCSERIFCHPQVCFSLQTQFISSFSLPPSLLPFLLSSFPSLFLLFLPLFLSSNTLQVSTKCQIPAYKVRKTQSLPSWSLQTNVGNKLKKDGMSATNDYSSCEVEKIARCRGKEAAWGGAILDSRDTSTVHF